MKKLHILVSILFFSLADAQTIYIPDVHFKGKLLASHTDNYSNYYITAADINQQDIVVDTNGNGEIEVNEAQTVYYLTVQGIAASDDPTDITDLTGIAYFTNLIELNCADNVLTTLDVSALSNLKYFRCDRNNLSALNISGLTNLVDFAYGSNHLPNVDASNNIGIRYLYCDNNMITSLNVTDFIDLRFLVCSNNLLSVLDLSNNREMTALRCDYNQLQSLDTSNFASFSSLWANNNPLATLNLKCGPVFSYQNLTAGNMNLSSCPTLQYVCADDYNVAALITKIAGYGYTNCHVNSYCSFTPGGNYYIVSGEIRFDDSNNGCDNEDVNYPNFNLKVTTGTTSVNFIADDDGNYSIPLQAGSYTLTPQIENPSFYNIDPSSVILNLPSGTNPEMRNFCVTRNGDHIDVETLLLPLNQPRPGFDSKYKIIYKNNGNITVNGSISFQFDDLLMDLISSDVALAGMSNNQLNWQYLNLQPFERREINIVLNLNTPTDTPPVIGGTDLGFSADITPIDNDENYQNNHSELKQKAVNAFDPNDKTCLEGNIVTPEMIGKEVHYMIRFENTGTANAENIVVKDMIDTTKFDINSLIPIDGSAPFVTRINGNKVEFIFENIQLPFDDTNNDGFVAFKIKTKPTLVLGDTFSNAASIYFDYNFPIVTNTATTTITALAKTDFEFENYFRIYPNPADTILNIETKQQIEITSVSIYNTLGQLVLIVPNPQKTIDVSGLKTGNYFIKITSNKGSSTQKLVKE